MKLDEINPIRATKEEIDRFRILSNALLSGQTVKIEEHRYKLAETSDSSAFLPIIILEDDMVLGSNFDFSELFQIAQKLTEDEVAIMVSNSVINSIGRRL